MVEPVVLTDEEQALWDAIQFDTSNRLGCQLTQWSEDAAHALMLSLVERGALPEVRVRYFTDPELHVGSSRSRMQIFEDNGTSGQDIYRHPHFARHLRYFLLGPDLPPRVIADFAQALADCGQVTSGDQEGLQRLGRTLVRTFGLDRRLAAEEFFKLAVELGLDTTYARGIRDSVMKIKAR